MHERTDPAREQLGWYMRNCAMSATAGRLEFVLLERLNLLKGIPKHEGASDLSRPKQRRESMRELHRLLESYTEPVVSNESLEQNALYAREQFGPRWADVDRNGCDTRNDILNRDLTDRTWRPGTHGCVVIGGTLADPYTGTAITFAKERAADVQIDHVVALSNAWQAGAQQLDPDTRRAFANDPLGLLAVDGRANQQKGDGDAATWLPPNRAFWCPYVARQVAVKAKYRLWTTPAEHAAIARVLERCPDEPVPVG